MTLDDPKLIAPNQKENSIRIQRVNKCFKDWSQSKFKEYCHFICTEIEWPGAQDDISGTCHGI